MEKSAAEVQTKEQYNQEIPHKQGKETKNRKNREYTNGRKG